jgi:hypothetical protein
MWLVLLLLIPVVAWGMWLVFCRSITKMHGVEALKAAPPIARAFPVTHWVGSIRHVGQRIAGLLDRGRSQD